MEQEPKHYDKLLSLSRVQDMFNGRLRMSVVNNHTKRSTIDISNLPRKNEVTLANTYNNDGGIYGVYLAEQTKDGSNLYLGLSCPMNVGQNLIHLLNPTINFVDEE